MRAALAQCIALLIAVNSHGFLSAKSTIKPGGVSICSQRATPKGLATTMASKRQWWRFFAFLEDSGGNKYDVAVTFTQVRIVTSARVNGSRWVPASILTATAVLIDEGKRKFLSASRLDREALGLASADGKNLGLQIGDWTLSEKGSSEGSSSLNVALGDLSINVQGKAVKAPVRLLSDDDCSFAYTRLRISGALYTNGHKIALTGSGWIDHEIGLSSTSNSNIVRWSRFYIQFDDGRELNIEVFRKRDGRLSVKSIAVLVGRDGSLQSASYRDLFVDNRGGTHVVSARTGHRYPSLWELAAPGLGLDVSASPPVLDQEVADSSLSQSIYDGVVLVDSVPNPGALRGRGFVELVGYIYPIQL